MYENILGETAYGWKRSDSSRIDEVCSLTFESLFEPAAWTWNKQDRNINWLKCIKNIKNWLEVISTNFVLKSHPRLGKMQHLGIFCINDFMEAASNFDEQTREQSLKKYDQRRVWTCA
jgi:hypothetical protein